jgi:predicted  nucleic acid-binding Zn-ribbon protein
LADESKRLEEELLDAERVLPPELRQAYDRMVKVKGADAMAQVEGETCGGCFQSITPNMFNDLLMSRVLFCKSCGRLLYLSEDRSPGKK